MEMYVTFDISCGHCAANKFQIFCFPKIAPDPSPYYMLEPGQTLYRPPYSLKCMECGKKALLFDIRKHGYDAVLNDIASYESGEEGESETAVDGDFNVTVSVGYNVELEELLELAAEASVQPQDLFDTISINGINASGDILFAADFECS
jgi:hypothetical protein